MGELMREQTAVLALVRASPAEWHRTADVIAEAGSALRLLDGTPAVLSADHQAYADELVSRVAAEDMERAQELIESTTAQSIRLITVLGEDYPENLNLVYNRPPFLWVRGHLDPRNMRAIAVVGTRQATTQGRATATRLARELADAKVVVLSGLARGIDTAAHTAALEAGGSTVAVIGTGILARVYPPENAELAARIVEQGGAIVSQFWPDAPPRRMNFPLRNVVMSGLSAGTVVVEASATSGAKMQARLALEHGKRLFLPQQLVKTQDWAGKYASRPGVTVIRSLDDILQELVRVVEAPRQLSLSL